MIENSNNNLITCFLWGFIGYSIEIYVPDTIHKVWVAGKLNVWIFTLLMMAYKLNPT